jgi:hypothetical protein
MKFEKIIQTGPPFDKRNSDPNKNYGIGSLTLWFILKKGQKAVQVVINTNSYLNSITQDYFPKFLKEGDYEGYSCCDVGYHSNKPTYKGQLKMDCHLLKRGFCYYDGSSLRGKDDNIAENYIKHGEKWIWEYLENYWKEVFE